METVTIHEDDVSPTQPWRVSVAGLNVRFASEAEALAYAEQLQNRISAPHNLPYEEQLPELP